MTRFITDSCSDMIQTEGGNFVSVPLVISTDEKEYVDDAYFDLHEMLDDLSVYKGKSGTACPSVESWLHAFEGADTIFVVTMTSALSGTYNSALVAKKIYEHSHPEAKIHVFDTLSAGPELRLLMEKLFSFERAGKTFEEIVRCGEKYLQTTRLFFALKSLHNLAQNGRVNKVIAAAAGALGAVIPSFLMILALATFMSSVRDSKMFTAFFNGIKPVTVALIFISTIKMAKSAKLTLKTIILPISVGFLVAYTPLSPIVVIILTMIIGNIYFKWADEKKGEK